MTAVTPGDFGSPEVRELDAVPVFPNPLSEATARKLPDFVWNVEYYPVDDLRKRPPVELENGAVYLGTFNN